MSSQPSPLPERKTLYLIDGSGFIFRAYHALPPLTNASGVPVGAVLGFVNMLIKLMEGNKADYVAVIFDASRVTFRNRIYADYKAHRPPAPDDLIPQFALVREATRAMNLPAIELEDYEADDIIATYACEAHKAGIDVTIVSSDKDLMQCIDDGVGMFDPMKQKPIGAPEVMEKFGVTPDKVLDVLSLIGDTSDNVPGVPGIGPKTAAELINLYGDLEGLLSRCGEIKQPKRRECITSNAEQARISKQLIALKCDVPLPLPLDSLALKQPEPATLLGFLQTHGLKSVLTRMQQKFGMAPPPPPATPKAELPAPAPVEKRYMLISEEATLADWVAQARKQGYVAFDTETTGLNAMQAELVGVSLALAPGRACYVPLKHRTALEQPILPAGDLFSAPLPMDNLLPGQIPFDRAIALLKPLLEDPGVLKIGHNMKYDMQIMRRYGVNLATMDDTMLLSYTLHAGEHGQSMDELAERYLNYQTIPYDAVTGTGRNRKSFAEVELVPACDYAAEDADITLRLYEFFKPRVASEKMLTLYETIERPLVGVLARMECAGVKVDVGQLADLSADFAARMQELEREIYQMAGHPFNIGSPKQLGEVLFDELQLPGGKKSGKTGAYGTDSGVLEELDHPLPARVLEWRQLSKLKSTYSDSLANQIDDKTGRVHTCFAMALTSTGRLSSSDPNLQNIPIRTTEGKKIREAFVAAPGYTLLSADYSQIELRLLAHMADIPTLRDAFIRGDDIHAITASQMFGVPVPEVSADLRRSAKTINFGIIYGISAHGLATRLGIGRAEAATYIDQYFRQYPGIRDYMERSKSFAREHGYVETMFGRRCHVPGILDKNAARRQFSERAAINAPLQGTAADIIKRAMIAIDRRIQGTNLPLNPESRPLSSDMKMLLQVHDELVFEIKESDIQAAQSMVKKEMEQAAHLSVPLTVETGVGSHWGAAH